MRVVIGYESMYGNTRRVAEAVAAGFAPGHDLRIEPIANVDPTDPDLDVLVIGVPTHAHGLPRPSSRRAAADGARTKQDVHQLEPSADAPGVREWLERLPDQVTFNSAAFDTRFRPPGWLVGHPARRISRVLHRHGATVLAPPASFFIDKHEELVTGELERAQEWGSHLCRLAERDQPSRRRGPQDAARQL